MTFDTNWEGWIQIWSDFIFLTFEDFTPFLILNEVRTHFYQSLFNNFLLYDIWHKLRLPKANLNLFHIFNMWRFYPWMKSKLNFHQNLLDNFFLYDILHKLRQLNSNLKWFHILDIQRIYPFLFWMKSELILSKSFR